MKKDTTTIKTFLVAHSNHKGTGIAQAQIRSRTEGGALKKFSKRFGEDRIVKTVGIEGVE